LVLDTNVVVSALFRGGTPRLLLEAGRAWRTELFTSTPLLVELTDVLNTRKFERKLAESRLRGCGENLKT
jgi:predicted nucleic acid-binding protein